MAKKKNETPATETPATETPATETPATETPATEATTTEATEATTTAPTAPGEDILEAYDRAVRDARAKLAHALAMWKGTAYTGTRDRVRGGEHVGATFGLVVTVEGSREVHARAAVAPSGLDAERYRHALSEPGKRGRPAGSGLTESERADRAAAKSALAAALADRPDLADILALFKSAGFGGN